MSRFHPRLDHWSPVPGETQPNPLAALLHQANISNTTHGRSGSPLYLPPNTVMPPEDSPFQTTIPSPAIPRQGLPMYPQITYTSPNEPEGGTSAQHGHPNFHPLDPPQSYGSEPWSLHAQAPNSFNPDPHRGYGAYFSPRDSHNLPSQGGMLSKNTYPSPQRSPATESLHNPGSQATPRDLDSSYRHAYPKEPPIYQHQSSSSQFMGSYGCQASSPAGNSGVDRDDAAGGYDSRTPSGAGDYGNQQAFPGPPQYSKIESAGNAGLQPTSNSRTTRESGIELKFPTPESMSTIPRGRADSILNSLSVASAIQRTLPRFSQGSVDQGVQTTNPARFSPYPYNAEVEYNVNSTRSDVHSQQRDLRRANPSGFDERWLRQTEDVWNLATRRTSQLTISPGEMTPEQQENTEASTDEARSSIVAPERRESRFKALQLFDSSSEDSRQHEELASENGRQVETLNQHSDRRHTIAVSQAYSRLGIHNQTLDDCTVLITYFRSGFSSPSQIDELRKALTIVAEARDSQYLRDFLSSGGTYCNPEDNEERRTILDSYAAGEDRCKLQSATTVSSSPDRTLTAIGTSVRAPEPSIGGDEASPVHDRRQADVCNQNLSGAIMLKRTEERLASLSVAPSRTHVAKSEVSSDEAEGGIRLDAAETCYPLTLENPQQDLSLTENSLVKDENLPDPYFRPLFVTQHDVSEPTSAFHAASALAASLPEVLSTRPGKTVLKNALTHNGREVYGVEGAEFSAATVRKVALKLTRSEPQSTTCGGQAGPANTQTFAPQPNQLYHPVFDSNGQMQWQAYDPGTMFPPPKLPQQPPYQQYQPQSFQPQPQPQRFPPQPMHFYRNPQAYPPHLMNYNFSGAPQQNQFQQAMTEGYQGIAPQQFAQQQFNPQQFAPQQFAPPLNHQHFPQAPPFPPQYQSYNMPPNYGSQGLPSHLHPDPRIQALPSQFWSTPSTGFPPAEAPTRTSSDPTWMERYGPDTQRAARHDAPVYNRPALTRQAAVISTLPVLPYQPGTDTMYPRSFGGASVRLQELTRNGQPAYETATNAANLPFVETAREAKPAEWGVLRVGNIPYTVTKAEILAHLGRNAKIITPDLGCAVHIIMDRATAKTMDCFVEFFSSGDAQAVVNKHRRTCDDGRHPRLGDRYVEMEMSTQGVLMKELFPKAKNVTWLGGDPKIVRNDEPYNSGFRSFITGEELVMMVKHAEQPHRSPYSNKCPQRTYECMISTLHKFPWWSTTNYTLSDRNKLFAATHDLLAALVRHLKHAEHGSSNGLTGLTESLLTDLLYAGLNAPGFSERQRSELLQVSEWAAVGVRVSPLAKWWPFEVVGRKKGVDEDVVQFYASLLATSASTSSSPTTVLTPTSTSTLSPTRSRSLLPHPETAESHFGAFSVDLEGSAPDGQSTGSGKDNGSGSAVGKAKGNKTGNGKAKGNGRGSSGSGSLTMREVAEVEWRALREALGRVLEA